MDIQNVLNIMATRHPAVNTLTHLLTVITKEDYLLYEQMKQLSISTDLIKSTINDSLFCQSEATKRAADIITEAANSVDKVIKLAKF